MENKTLLVLAVFYSCLLQVGCVSTENAIPCATLTRADFRVRDPFVLAENGVYYLYESKP